jgi:hypothetical protein
MAQAASAAPHSSREEAALEAGERPTPHLPDDDGSGRGCDSNTMILPHSSLWSPLASVLASGLVFSMSFVFLVVPVLFVIVEKRSEGGRGPSKLAPVIAVLTLCFAGTLHAQSPPKLTLPEAVDLALKQNSGLQIGRAKVRGNQYHAAGTRADELPQVKTDAALFGIAKTQNLTIPAGALGAYPGFGLLPGSAIVINQGSQSQPSHRGDSGFLSVQILNLTICTGSNWCAQNVQENQSSATCNERNQTPRIGVSHRKHPKPRRPQK